MNTAPLSLIVTILFWTPFICADTLTLRNNAEVNGRVGYADGAFSILASYANGGFDTRKFDRKEVLTLEFNQRVVNPGPPSKDISVFHGRESATKDAAHQVMDTDKSGTSSHLRAQSQLSGHTVLSDNYNPSDDVILLRNRKKLAGRLVKIENGQITVQSGKKRKKSIDSGQVATVLIAPN